MKKMILIAALLAVSLVSKAQLVGTGITKSFHRLSFNLFNEILKTEEGWHIMKCLIQLRTS